MIRMVITLSLMCLLTGCPAIQDPQRMPFKQTTWSLAHPEEAKEHSTINKPAPELKSVYIMPIGDAAVSIPVAEFIQACYNVPVCPMPPVSTQGMPSRQGTLGTQLNSMDIVYKTLLPARPKDAIALLGVTELDLWPGDSWNYVFGQASLTDRVGVYSLRRYGSPGDPGYLLRAAKVALHELGHMYGLGHCVAYQCLMNGSNNLAEADAVPMTLCYECALKLQPVTGLSPRQHYEATTEVITKYKENR